MRSYQRFHYLKIVVRKHSNLGIFSSQTLLNFFRYNFEKAYCHEEFSRYEIESSNLNENSMRLFYLKLENIFHLKLFCCVVPAIIFETEHPKRIYIAIGVYILILLIFLR